MAAVAAALGLVGWQTPAAQAGGAPCAEKVLRDWTDNGRIDGLYPSKCYVDAIASLPEDVRTYSSAVDDISRAMDAAQRVGSAKAAGKGSNGDVRRLSSEEARQIASQTPSTVDGGHPPALLAAIAIAGLVAISGLAAYLLRRWRDFR